MVLLLAHLAHKRRVPPNNTQARILKRGPVYFLWESPKQVQGKSSKLRLASSSASQVSCGFDISGVLLSAGKIGTGIWKALGCEARAA